MSMTETERYIDWKQLGKGAFATVYGAFDQEIGVKVAIKLLHDKVSSNTRVVDGLRSECRISRLLRHESICPIHDMYEGPRGVGIVMDWIDGMELSGWLKKNRGSLLATASERFELFVKLVQALKTAHTHIIHRDLKPDNIFIRKGDPRFPVIMDFGISVVGESDSKVAGTPKYMAPEQYEAPDLVDQRSDLFSLGVIAYELFTDQIPPTSLRRVLKTRKPPRVSLEEITPPSRFCASVPVALDRMILQLMAYEQINRPQSASEILRVLEQIHLKEVDLAQVGRNQQGQSRQNRPEMPTVDLEGGKFYIGSGPESNQPVEKPRRRLLLSPFRMDLHPVTNRMYRFFVETTGYTRPPMLDDSLFGQDDHPVVGVDFEEAQAYAQWAGGMLPTEAQWEYAAKGGAKFVAYPWGEALPTAAFANIDNVSRTTSPVESCPSGRNPYGLLDMCGNVWEWCRDLWSPSYYGTLSNGDQDPLCVDAGSAKSQRKREHVLRGGAFDSFATMGRCAFRFHAPPETRRASIGFRLVYPQS